MQGVILGLLAETEIHCGTGRSQGVIDLPIAREGATDFPFIPGSGLKGALRDRAQFLRDSGDRSISDDEIKKFFGESGYGGQLLFSDARLLLLPVRSLHGAYRWVTCELVLERYVRDSLRCGRKAQSFDLKIENEDKALGDAITEQTDNKLIILEEREFEITGKPPQAVCEEIESLIPHEKTRQRLSKYLVVVADSAFTYFCRYAVPVQARNVLDDESKTSKNLWYEESLPPDTLMYAVVHARSSEALQFLRKLFPESDRYLQVGGNETVGQGWMAVHIVGEVRQ